MQVVDYFFGQHRLGLSACCRHGGMSRDVLPSLLGARLSSLALAGHSRPHLSFQIPLSQDVEAQGLEALLQLPAVHIGTVSSQQIRFSTEVDVVDDQTVSARVRFQLINLAGTRGN